MTKEAASGLFSLVLAFACGWFAHGVDWSQIDLPIPVPVVNEKPPLESDKPRVLFVYETNDKVTLPRGYRSIIDSAPFRQWLREQGFEFRYLDPQSEQGTDNAWWYQAKELPHDESEWLYVVNGNKWYAGKWPEDVEAAKVLIGGLK